MCRRKGKAWILLLFYVSVRVYFIIGYLQCRHSYKYIRSGQPNCYFRLLVVVRIIWVTFSELATVENPRFAVWISTLCIIVPEIWALPVWAAILLFLLVGRRRSHLRHFLWTRHGRKPQICSWNFDATYHSSTDICTSGLGLHIATSGCRSSLQSSLGISLNSSLSKIRDLPLEFRRCLHYFQRYKYFQFGLPYCYFRLSVIVAVISGALSLNTSRSKIRDLPLEFRHHLH